MKMLQVSFKEVSDNLKNVILMGVIVLSVATGCLSTGSQPGSEMSAVPAIGSLSEEPDKSIRVDDLLEVVVQRQPEFSITRRVANDGTLYTPILGQLALQGMTPEEAAGLIRERLMDGYLVNPDVTVIVVERAKKKFVILGQVKSPGYYSVPGDLQVTLIEAVAMAGGYTRISGNVKVTRVVEGKEQVMEVNRKSSNEDSTFVVRAGDTIQVEESIF
jgi:protein involved in polysaccharide export with SLBB domain